MEIRKYTVPIGKISKPKKWYEFWKTDFDEKSAMESLQKIKDSYSEELKHDTKNQEFFIPTRKPEVLPMLELPEVLSEFNIIEFDSDLKNITYFLNVEQQQFKRLKRKIEEGKSSESIKEAFDTYERANKNLVLIIESYIVKTTIEGNKANNIT